MYRFSKPQSENKEYWKSCPKSLHTHRILLCWIPQWVSIGTARDCPWRQVCCLPTVQTVRSSRCSGCNATAAARRTSTRCSSRDTENQNGQSFPTFLRFFGGSSSWLFLSEKSFLNDFSRLPRVFSSEKQACEKTTSALSSETGHGWTSQIVLPSVTYVSVYQSF